MAAAFGFSAADLFSHLDPVPVASGSIGQIHRAVLSGAGARLTGMAEGSVVAVKVRHPGVSEAIERDFALMVAAARAAAALPALRALRLEESLKQFAAPLREQVDLSREGLYLHAFNYNFRAEREVSFPVPLYPLVAPSVLVESFEEGGHISEYVARGAGAPHNSRLARLGARTMLHMLVADNLVHSDLHPGEHAAAAEPAPPPPPRPPAAAAAVPLFWRGHSAHPLPPALGPPRSPPLALLSCALQATSWCGWRRRAAPRGRRPCARCARCSTRPR